MRPNINKFLFHSIVALLFSQLVSAATTDTPRARIEIEKYGSAYSATQIGELRAIYKMHHAEAGFETSDTVRDIHYGPNPQHRLDVHRPKNASETALPVLVFIHGGAFVRGDKSDGEIFDNVLNYFAARGVVGVNATYRLAPEFKWPAGAEDVAAVVEWIRENISDHGGNPDNIFLMGHSAGAAHVVTYAFMEELQPEGGEDGVRGAILMSGFYANSSEESKRVYYGSNPESWDERMPISFISGRRIPLFIVSAEYDGIIAQKEAAALVSAICERDVQCPMHKQVQGHNHFSLMYHINTADDSVASDIMDFIERKARKQSF